MKISPAQWLPCLLLITIFRTPLADPSQQNITLNMQQIPLPVALKHFADYQQLNLVVSKQVNGTLTLRLVNVPWQQALEAILQAHRLTKVAKGPIWLITQQSAAEEPGSLLTEGRQPAHQLLETTCFTIHYAKADVLAALLQQPHPEGLLSSSGSIYVDKRTNRLLIRDGKEHMIAIKKFIEQFDQAAEQVQIEARIVTISHEDLAQLGISWQLGAAPQAPALGTHLNHFATHLPISNAPSRYGLQIAKISRQLLDLELTALEQENRLEIIASPRLLTTNRHTASIKQGSEIPYAVTKGNNTTSIEFREAVLGLEATPYATPNGRIIVDLKISQNTPGRTIKMAQGEAIAIDKQEINTQVTVSDGETVVLGGIFQRFGHQSRDYTPLLGKLPFIGHLFSRNAQQITKRELIIFITPRLLARQHTAPP